MYTVDDLHFSIREVSTKVKQIHRLFAFCVVTGITLFVIQRFSSWNQAPRPNQFSWTQPQHWFYFSMKFFQGPNSARGERESGNTVPPLETSDPNTHRIMASNADNRTSDTKTKSETDESLEHNQSEEEVDVLQMDDDNDEDVDEIPKPSEDSKTNIKPPNELSGATSSAGEKEDQGSPNPVQKDGSSMFTFLPRKARPKHTSGSSTETNALTAAEDTSSGTTPLSTSKALVVVQNDSRSANEATFTLLHKPRPQVDPSAVDSLWIVKN